MEVCKFLIEDLGLDVNHKAGRKCQAHTPLFFAARHGLQGTASSLLEAQARLDQQDLMQQTPLFWAAVGGNLPVLELLLAQSADACHQDMHKMTALFYAVKHDASVPNSKATLCVRALLSCPRGGARLGCIRGRSGQTALFYAVEHGTLEMISLLLENSCSVDEVDESGQSPLFYAAKSRSDFVKYLLDASASADLQDHQNQTPLCFAVANNQVEACRILLGDGKANPHVTSITGWSPYSMVLKHASTKPAELLKLFQALPPAPSLPARAVTKPAAPTRNHLRSTLSHPKTPPAKRRKLVRGKAWGSPQTHQPRSAGAVSSSVRPRREPDSELARAILHGTPDQVRTLFRAGHSPRWLDIGTGRNLLHMAALRRDGGDSEAQEMCKMLISEQQLDPSYLDGEGRTPLFHAVAGGLADCAAHLIACKGQTCVADRDGRTPLHIVASMDAAKCTSLLLAHAADPFAKDKHGSSPVLEAAVKGKEEQLRSMLSPQSASILNDPGVSSALLRNAATSCISVLASAGCKVDFDNGFIGELSPLHLAAQEGAIDRVEALLDAKAAINRQDIKNGLTPLHCSLQNKDAAMCQMLLTKYGADPDLKDAQGRTPAALARRLQWKAGADMLETLSLQKRERAAAEQKARAEALNRKWAACANAAGAGPLPELRRLAQELLSHCAGSKGATQGIDFDMSAPAFASCRVLHSAAGRSDGGEQAAVEACDVVLNDLGVEVDCRDPAGRTALFDAAYHGNALVCSHLLARRCDVNATDRKGRNAAFWAAMEGRTSCLQIMLDAAADAGRCDSTQQTALLLACRHSHVACVSQLLKAKAPPNISDAEGIAPLTHAAMLGATAAVQALVAARAAVNRPDPHGRTALFAAVRESRADTAVLLLDTCGARPPGPGDVPVMDDGRGNRDLIDMARDRGFLEVEERLRKVAAINQKSFLFCPDMLQAASSGDPADVSKLLQRSASPNSCKRDGRTALHHAAGRHDGKAQAVLERLLAAPEASPNQPDHQGQTPLFLAAFTGLQASVELLLTQRSDIEISDDRGQTAIFAAVRSGTRGILSLLLERSADVNHRDKDGRTVAFSAVGAGASDMLQVILDSPEGRRSTQPDINGQTPLFQAQDVACAKLLIERRCDLSAKDNLGQTALHALIQLDAYDTVCCLLEHGALVNDRNLDGSSALHFAKDRSMVLLLLRLRAVVGARNNESQTPLFRAVERRDPGMVRALLRADADSNAVDKHGRSALFLAARASSLEIVRMLVCEGFADPNQLDGQHQTAQQFAEKCEHSQKDVLQYLAKLEKNMISSSAADSAMRRRYRLAFEESDDRSGHSVLTDFSSEQYAAKLREIEMSVPNLFKIRHWSDATT
eukprot:TRINITY_DN27395_c0_g1_i1.p1 TRINITY_DN27395_c0_g1~~TRINITY_DN27395_c0_g1_i1.p1  ORF type:complete len:1417 (+),score=220.45 TRINITY_DN27395_c0_g1_i1:168-4253(+)